MLPRHIGTVIASTLEYCYSIFTIDNLVLYYYMFVNQYDLDQAISHNNAVNFDDLLSCYCLMFFEQA